MSSINGFTGRRDFLMLAIATSLGVAASSVSGTIVWGLDNNRKNPKPVSPDVALRRLLDGNCRFIHQKRKYPDQSLKRLQTVAASQHPFASILGCADSRVPTEIIFDQGLGNLFVLRVPGNVASDIAIGSLEYSTSVLGSQLIIVLGHRKCGAVIEAINNEPLPGKIGLAIEGIKPALKIVNLTTGDIREDAVIANIQYQTAKLLKSNILAKLIAENKLKILGALYDIDTGVATIIT
jgi:carbonic anhydrase